MAALRPHTKTYDQSARDTLGLAVARAREAAGYPKRPAFARAAGIGVTSLFKLETGEPVGPTVYEAAARALPGWDEGSPRRILEGEDVDDVVTSTVEPEERLPEPQPADYPGEMEYLQAVYWYLRQDMSHEAVMRGFNMAAALYSKRKAHRNQGNTDSDAVG